MDTDTLVSTDAGTVWRRFDEDTREGECFGCAFLDTMVSDV